MSPNNQPPSNALPNEMVPREMRSPQTIASNVSGSDSSSSEFPRSVELLSPAGDWQCARAAIENGANAIYFGLDCGFNARYRAQNFGLDDLPDLMRLLRMRGVRGYVTMNTLAFPSELSKLVDVIHAVSAAGVDAVLVQDFGVARIVRAICPELEIHASTQMSLTSAETIAVASQLGLSRAVVARELSIDDIRKITSSTDMPIEVFIHGALCVAYSGQCLTSESLGGRSANRGQCAQACRLPYELVVDDKDRDLDQVRYLLSPQDLAGYAAIPDLIDAGVASLKIEGRLKTPEYVANITGHYRRAIDEAIKHGTVTVSDESRREMELSFSRGFSPGWIEGNDHKRLVPGLQSSKRGIELGTIIEREGERIKLWIDAPLALGDGLAIPAAQGGGVQGGRIYSLDDDVGRRHKQLDAGQIAWVGFGRDEIDWSKVELDAVVFKNDDPKLNKRLRQSFEVADPVQRQGVNLQVTAEVGQPLRVQGTLANGISADVASEQPLEVARKHPADELALRSKLERFGGTPFRLADFHARISGGPMVPVGILNQVRRGLVDALAAQLEQPMPRAIDVKAGRTLLEPITSHVPRASDPKLTVLCRTMAQLRSVVQSSVELVYVDFHDIREYGDAVKIAHDAGKPIGIGTIRMQKPGEMGFSRVLLRHRPDWILARNLAAIQFFRDEGVPTIADFSLNVANHRSAEWIRSLGVERVTASYDLNREQLSELVGAVPADWMEVVIHQHMPMFHMEHCVFCAVISPGTNKTNCGRPCDRHVVQLRDRVGAQHPLQADVACRNTLYNEQPQSGAETVSELQKAGVSWFRIELLQQEPSQCRETIDLYQRLLSKQLSAREVWQKLNATNRVGVTRGTLESERNPLAIL